MATSFVILLVIGAMTVIWLAASWWEDEAKRRRTALFDLKRAEERQATAVANEASRVTNTVRSAEREMFDLYVETHGEMMAAARQARIRRILGELSDAS